MDCEYDFSTPTSDESPGADIIRSSGTSFKPKSTIPASISILLLLLLLLCQ